MTHDLERMKKELELSKVKCGMDELNVRVFERELDIKRMKESIEVQKKRIEELTNELKE